MSGIGPSVAEEMEAAVKKAAPFIDAAWDAAGKKWMPSDLIRIGFYAAATRNPESAVQFANDMLDEARNRYAAGFYADPFMEPVRVRPDAATPPQKGLTDVE